MSSGPHSVVCSPLIRQLMRGAVVVVCSLLLCVRPALLAAASRTQTDDSGTGSLDIHDLATGLADAPGPLRADFAHAALSELILAYQREAHRARAEGQRGGSDRELLRWSRAVNGLVADLQRLADSLTAETPVAVRATDVGPVSLVVDGNPVLLSGPRSGEKTSLEQRVLQRFCRRNDCREWLREESAAGSAPVVAVEPTLWRFADAAGPVCATGDGLEFQFRNTDDLNAKREACGRVVAELNALSDALQRKIDSGTPVDWNRLAIYPAPGTPLQRVILNADGDYLLLSAPALQHSRALFRLVLPWLAAKVAGKRFNLVVLNTERLLLLPGHPPRYPLEHPSE